MYGFILKLNNNFHFKMGIIRNCKAKSTAIRFDLIKNISFQMESSKLFVVVRIFSYLPLHECDIDVKRAYRQFGTMR